MRHQPEEVGVVDQPHAGPRALHDDGERIAAEAERLRRATEALTASEQRHRLLAENASDIVVQASPDGRAMWVSPSIEAALGRSVEEVLGREVIELVNPEHVAVVRNAQRSAARGEVPRFEAQYRHKDGHYKWFAVMLKPVYDDEGTIIGRVGSWRDIDEERKVKEALDVARERDRLVARLASDAFVVVSPEGLFQWASGATERLFGLRPEQMIGEHAGSFLDEFGARMSAEHLDIVRRGEIAADMRRVVRPDGTHRWVDTRSMGIFDEHGVLQSVASSVRDAQAEMEYRDALRTAMQEARAANLAKTTFLSRMSHELRTPLNAVLGFAQILQLDDLTPEQDAAVRHILTGGNHLLELINEVLDIARIESGGLNVSPVDISLGVLVAEAVEMVRPLAALQHVTVHEFDPSTVHAVVRVDRQRAVQILLNLLSNAIKYNRAEGMVEVECRHDLPGTVTVAVRDQGAGISPTDMDKLFTPFERLGAAQRGIDGTGIGLALSRGLAEMMNARVEASSVVGEGSEFRLVIPLAAASPR
jgi:PAS domain S-box-containing protein